MSHRIIFGLTVSVMCLILVYFFVYPKIISPLVPSVYAIQVGGKTELLIKFPADLELDKESVSKTATIVYMDARAGKLSRMSFDDTREGRFVAKVCKEAARLGRNRAVRP